jgi:hypothetical protein
MIWLVQAESKAELNVQESKVRASRIYSMAVEIEDKAYEVKVILLGWLKDIMENLSISTFSSTSLSSSSGSTVSSISVK